MTAAEEKRWRYQCRRAFFHDLVLLVRSGRSAIRRGELGLAIQMLSAAAYELGVARERHGATAAAEMLCRSILRLEHVVAHAVDPDPTDVGTRIAMALFRANLGARKGPKRSPLRVLAPIRLLAEKEAAS